MNNNITDVNKIFNNIDTNEIKDKDISTDAYEKIKRIIQLEKQELQKNKKYKSEYTIVINLVKVYYDLLMSYKGDIDAIFDDLLNDKAIDPEGEKPYIISSYDKNIVSNIDSVITTQLHSNYSYSFPTQSISSHTHNINYIDDHSDYIDINDYIFINNNDVLECIINKGYWEYCTKECKQKLILNNYITDGYARYKDLHDVNFCVEYIQRNPKQEVICETHPEIMQTKEFQKYVKILKMKNEYQPY
ncbi:hypothetical protein PBI_SCTP2_465 [Salicola phage SCTP-2]|nr:hypothetical protein PBI_SCTP2_465 [Salicola phage SCTP-2]